MPERGAELARPPEAVELYFNEPVEAASARSASSTRRGDRGRGRASPIRPGGRSAAIGVALPEDLATGRYTATYRVVSADSHPISGGFVFNVGTPVEPGAPRPFPIFSAIEAGPVTDVAFGGARGASLRERSRSPSAGSCSP